MAPSPDLHKDEQDNTDGDIGSKHDIAAPEKHPAPQEETNLCQDSSNEGQQGHPEAPSDGNLEVLRHIHSDLPLLD